MPEPESLDTDEPLAKRMARHRYDRLLMLSDGVFAIAITLAALGIRPPQGSRTDVAGLLAAMRPALFTYGVSFLVISAYWLSHRRIFAQLRGVDPVASILNLALLGLVALQPAAVELLTRLGTTGGALALYFGLIIAIGAVQALLWGYAAFIGHLVDASIPRRVRWAQLIASLVIPITACVLSIYSTRTRSPLLALAALGAMVSMSLLRHRLTRHPAAAPAPGEAA